MQLLALNDIPRQIHALRAGRELLSIEQQLALADQLHNSQAPLAMQVALTLRDRAGHGRRAYGFDQSVTAQYGQPLCAPGGGACGSRL